MLLTVSIAFSIFKLRKQLTREVTMAKNEELEQRIAENMTRFGGTREFWERRLTHGWDAIEAKLSKLKAQGMTMEQIVESMEAKNE